MNMVDLYIWEGAYIRVGLYSEVYDEKVGPVA